jgi:recombination associated protein RdgC
VPIPLFKNLTLYRLRAPWLTSNLEEALSRVDDALALRPFVPCSAGQAQSIGWVSPLRPRGLEDPTLRQVEAVADQWLLCLLIEQRLLPAAVVRRRFNELVREAEQATGRPPGRRQKQQLKEQAQMELMPRAFTRQTPVEVWIDPASGLLAINTSSLSRAEAVVTELVRSLEGVSVEPVQTQESPASVMAAWLQDGDTGAGFTLDRECELRSDDEMRSVVRYARHALDSEAIRAQLCEHIAQGKRPIRLALCWSDRVAFTLTETLQLRRLEFLDTVFEGREDTPRDILASFHTEAALLTAELGRLVPALIESLGGEIDAPLAA